MSDKHNSVPLLYADIWDFHKKFELQYEGNPRQLDDDLALFRLGFMVEELGEYAAACGFKRIGTALEELHNAIKKDARWMLKREERRDPVNQLDSLIDLVYVALGTSHLHGFDFDEGWRRVHEANMKKIRTARPEDSKRGSGFDVIKPKNWSPPDLSDLVEGA